jgi:cytochrome P450
MVVRSMRLEADTTEIDADASSFRETPRSTPRSFVRRDLPLAEELRRLPDFVSNYAGDQLVHHRRHGDVFVRRVGTPSVHLCHPQLLEHVLRSNVRNYVKGPDYDFLRPLIGEGIFVSEGDMWTRQRRLLAPEFRAKEVAGFLPVFTAELERLYAEWDESRARPPGHGSTIDVSAGMMRLTLRVLGAAMFQSDFESLIEVAREAFEACLSQATKQMVSMGMLKPWLPTPGNQRAREASRRLDDAVHGLIARVRAGLHPQHAPQHPGCPVAGVDMLSRMLVAVDPDTGTGMSEQQIVDEVKSLILAGHETTSLALSWTFHLLLTHPEVMAKLRTEVRSVLGGRHVQVDDVPRLPYTRKVLLESMRVYPPVPAVTRRALADDEFFGIRVRAGESVTLPIYTVHRHREFWSQPERFDPERFTPERVAKLHPYSYLPFLRGRRACLGEHFATLEAIVVLASIVDRYDFTRVGREPIGIRPVATLRSTRPLIVHAKLV